MAIALELETRDQIYKIYGGSSGFTNIIKASGFVNGNLSITEIVDIFGDIERRKQIAAILLEEGEFEPAPDISTEKKKEAFILKLARSIDNGWTVKLVARLINEINDASKELKAIDPPIATQDQIAEHIRQEAIARQSELPLEVQSNIAEGE